jgi:SAM-dependent methyltransferase
MRREWEGYITYTTDIRPEAEPDYVQDTRQLNLPDDHFDMVATAHHLEHFGRYEQEKIWAELVRICKPGGSVEFILPNLEWAAAKIVEQTTDERTFDVLYGAQERFFEDRKYNTHFFCYTPAIAKALAENAGLIDVEIRTYTDEPKMVWEMLLLAKKPKDDAERKAYERRQKKAAAATEEPKVSAKDRAKAEKLAAKLSRDVKKFSHTLKPRKRK